MTLIRPQNRSSSFTFGKNDKYVHLKQTQFMASQLQANFKLLSRKNDV